MAIEDEVVDGGVEEQAPVEVTETQPDLLMAESTAGEQSSPTVDAQAPAGGGEWTSVRDYAKQFGVELPHENDAAALGELLQAYQRGQQRDYYADLGRQVAPNAAEYQAWLQSRQAPAVPEERPKYRPPELKQEWLQMVERDEATGQLRSKQGYDPAIAQKVQEFADWREGFLTDPGSYIAPLVEERAAEIVRREMGQQQERMAAERVLAENASWLYRRDAEGRTVPGRDGRPSLSPEGQMFAQAVEHLSKQGLRDPLETARLARSLVENQVLRRELEKHRPATAQPAAPGTVHAPARNPQQVAPATGSPRTEVSSEGLSLREMLRRDLDAAGIREDAEVAL
jgi:hypothetical protein